MKSITLYSGLFPVYPIFIAILIPPYSIFLLGWNFIINTVILIIASKLCFKKVSGNFYKKTILPAWLLGFASIAIGSFAGLAEFFLDYYIDYDVSRERGCAVSFIVAVVMIFVFNLFITLNPKRLDHFKTTLLSRILISLSMTVLTAPYGFFLPEKYEVLLSNIWDCVLKFIPLM